MFPKFISKKPLDYYLLGTQLGIVMKKLAFVLIYTLSFTACANAANLLYRQSFETPIANNPEIEWTSPGYPLSQAVTTSNPKDGKYSIRGNFNTNVTDPITHMQGVPFVHFRILFDGVPALKNWYRTAPKIYASWWYKFDACDWESSTGYTQVNTPGDTTTVGAKLAYFGEKERPDNSSYYFSAQGGKSGWYVLQVNGDSWMNLWQTLYNKPSFWLSNNQQGGADGNWHHLGFLITTEATGAKYITWWMDNVLMTNSAYTADGRFSISPEFVLNYIQFFYSKQEYIDISKEAGVAGNYCNGWQIDDVQVWDDVPNNPLPPTPLLK